MKLKKHTKKCSTVCLEFKFNWVFCILSVNTCPSFLEVIYHKYVCVCNEYIS